MSESDSTNRPYDEPDTRDDQPVMRDHDDDEVLDLNERPGLLEGPFIPPVAMAGPSAGTPTGSPSLGTGVAPFPVPVVPVIEEGKVESANLVNPFTPADPDNEAPFEAPYPAPDNLPAAIEGEIASDARFRAAEVNVTVDEGVVTLQGAVASRGLRDDLESTVRRMPGVEDVVNDLDVIEG